MAKTLGDVVNAAGMEIGEPQLSAFTSGNIFHETMIKEANNAVRKVLARCRYRWGLHRTTFLTSAEITTDEASVTNGSATVTSVTSAGVNADSFTGAAVGMYFRVTGDLTSYKITAVDTASSPDTITLEQTFLGTTDASVGYKIIKDRYTITDTDFDEPNIVTINKSRAVASGFSGYVTDRRLDIRDPQSIYNIAGGDLHRDSSGIPGFIARLGVDDSDVTDSPEFLMWPYPDSAYMIEVLYSRKFTNQTTFAATLFGNDAPDIAYDIVEHQCNARATKWDGDLSGTQYWMGEVNRMMGELVSRENRTTESGNAMSVVTYRRGRFQGMESRSQIAFDTKSAVR